MEAAKDAGITVVSLPLVNQWTQVSHLELSLGDTYVSLTFTSGPIMEHQTHKHLGDRSYLSPNLG